MSLVDLLMSLKAKIMAFWFQGLITYPTVFAVSEYAAQTNANA